jgi:hypothetical protein
MKKWDWSNITLVLLICFIAGGYFMVLATMRAPAPEAEPKHVCEFSTWGDTFRDHVWSPESKQSRTCLVCRAQEMREIKIVK